MSLAHAVRGVVSALLAVIMSIPLATVAAASGPVALEAVFGGGPDLDEVFLVWDHEITTVDDPADFTVWDGEVLVATGTAAVIDAADSSQVNVELDQPLVADTAYTLEAAAGAVSAGEDTSGIVTGEAFTADNTPPTLESAAIEGDVLDLTFTEDLDVAHAPGGTAYTVLVDDAEAAIQSEQVEGAVVTLTLAAAVAEGAVVTVAYDSTGGTALRDRARNEVASLGPEEADNATDVAPLLESAQIDGASLELIYDQPLDGTSVPAADDFVVTVAAEIDAVSAVAINDAIVTLTLGTTVAQGDEVSVDYNPDVDPIRDPMGNDAAPLVAEPVTNVTDDVPTLVAASTAGDLITLEYSEALDETLVPSTTDFAVTIGADTTADVEAVAISEAVVTVDLVTAVPEHVDVVLDYTPGAAAITDLTGNEAAALVDQPIDNSTTVRPELSAAIVDGTAVTLTFTESLDPASVPEGTTFEIRADDAAGTVTDVAIVDDTVTLTLAAAVVEGAVIVSDYTPGAAPLRGLDGDDVEPWTDEPVENVTDTAPALQTATINGAAVVLSYDQALDEGSEPAPADFEVAYDAVVVPVTAVQVSGATVVLTMSEPATEDATVVLDYSPGTAPVRDPAGNAAVAIVDLAVTNVTDQTAPALTAAVVDGASLVLTFDEEFDEDVSPQATDFVVTADDTPIDVTNAAVSGAEVLLTLDSAPGAGVVVLLDYVANGGLRDAAGNEVGSFEDHPVDVATDTPAAVLGDDDPLRLAVSDQLRCQLSYETRAAYYADTACGTFVSVDGSLFGPEVPAGPQVLPFAPVSQSPVSGTGAAEDPFVVTTVVELTGTGITLTQVDSLVAGASETESQITLDNVEGEDAAIVVYRAADCALAGDDHGFGAVDTDSGSVSCVQADRSGDVPVPGTGAVTFRPGSPGAHYEAAYSDVWADLENGSSFDDTCTCDEDLDHGMGLSWASTLQASGTVTHVVMTEALIEPEAAEGGVPVFVSADVDGDVLAVWYDRQLDPEYSPDVLSWSVTGSTSGEIAVETGPAWGDGEQDHFLLILEGPVQPDEAVTLSYDSEFDPDNALRSTTGELAASFVDAEVANFTPLPAIDCSPPAVNAELTNMGFEESTEAEPHHPGWTAGDVADVIERTGPDDYTAPWEGDYMGRLGSTYASSEDRQPEGLNELCQDFVVTSAMERFAYNVFTYDYQGFDRFAFHLTVTDPDDGEVLAAYEQDSWGEDGDTSLKTSGWQGVTLDLSGHVGETVRLEIASGSTQDDLFGFWVYLDSAEGGLPAPSQPLSDVTTETGSSTVDPITGQTTVSMPFGAPSSVTLTSLVSCDGVLGDVAMLFGGASYPMTPTGQPGAYSVTIPQADIASAGGGALVTRVQCDGSATLTQVAKIVLYDPSGIVTDAVTGQPVVGASVTLFKVPGWVPRNEAGEGDCESNASRDGAEWSQPAPTDLGQQVSASSPEISPNVNPFVTNSVGYYGWNVAEGCWFVTVAKAGYVSLTSPVVGVPTEVTDLDLELHPESGGDDDDDDDGGGGGGGGGGGSGTALPPGMVVANVRPDASGNAAATMRLPSGSLTVVLRDLSAAGQLRVQELASSPLDKSRYLPVGTGYTLALQGARAAMVTVCVPSSARQLRGTGATSQEVRMLRTDGSTADVTTSVDRDEVCGMSGTPATFAAGLPKFSRIGGSDRVATAAALSASRFPTGTGVAYLATAEDFADALTGGPAAARENAPLLLTAGGELSDATSAELARLGTNQVVVLGGRAAVPDTVLAQLSSLGVSVTRMSGRDRYATAASVSAATFVPGVAEVFVATGENFPDALVGGAAAAHRGAPVLLVSRDEVPGPVADELARLDPAKLTVLGGTSAVSAAVAEQLQAFTSGEVSRISGPDRYATAAAISARYFGGGNTVFIATGARFADALSGVPAAALTGSPLLLVDGDRVPEAIRAELRRIAPVRSVVIGRGGAVSEAAGAEVGGLVR